MTDLTNYRGMYQGNLDPMFGTISFDIVSFHTPPTEEQWLMDTVRVFATVAFPQIAIVSKEGDPAMTFTQLLCRLWCDYFKLTKEGQTTSYTMRAPHHTISKDRMFGKIDDQVYYPGELEMARNGAMVLFDFEKFNKHTKERLLAGTERFDPNFKKRLMPCLKVFIHTVKTDEEAEEALARYREMIPDKLEPLRSEDDSEFQNKPFDAVIDLRRIANSMVVHKPSNYKIPHKAIIDSIISLEVIMNFK